MNRPEAFDEAVQIGRRYLADWQRGKPGAEFSMRSPDTMGDATLDQYLAERALNVRIRQWIADQIMAGEPIQGDRLRQFAASAVMGDPLPPHSKGFPVEIDHAHLKDTTIAAAVEAIVEAGALRRSRSPSSAPYSACDAVVEAARELGFYLSFQKVDQLAKRRRRGEGISTRRRRTNGRKSVR